MKYVLTWKRKRHGTASEFEHGQKRVLDMMRAWQSPHAVVVHQFVVKVGEPGGYIVFEAEDLETVHLGTAAFASLNFHIDPVVDIDDAGAGANPAVEWRDAVM